jgi:hypothetical protein
MKFIPLGLYWLVGIISLVMAYKNIFSSRFLPFHEKAAGKSWDKLDEGLQSVIIALMKVSGVGFLMVGLQLMIFPAISLIRHNIIMQYVIPALSFLYCLGLFLINYQLASKTKATTPWKGSLFAAGVIAAAMIIASF